MPESLHTSCSFANQSPLEITPTRETQTITQVQISLPFFTLSSSPITYPPLSPLPSRLTDTEQTDSRRLYGTYNSPPVYLISLSCSKIPHSTLSFRLAKSLLLRPDRAGISYKSPLFSSASSASKSASYLHFMLGSRDNSIRLASFDFSTFSVLVPSPPSSSLVAHINVSFPILANLPSLSFA